MTTQESLKPLVDKILKNPLEFRRATHSGPNNGSTPEIENETSRYIVIGGSAPLDTVGKAKRTVQDLALQNESEYKVKKRQKRLPNSISEAVALYTDVEKKENTESSASSDSEEDVFHEANQYLKTDDKTQGPSRISSIEQKPEMHSVGLEEDIGEDLGIDVEEEAPGDADDPSQRESSTEESREDLADTNFSASNSDASDDEQPPTKLSSTELEQLREENQEHEEEQEKIKSLQAERLKMDPASLDDKEEHEKLALQVDTQDCYQLNENENDMGSLPNQRIKKNWGSRFSSLRPKGLLNHGVTCYTNAAVQAMIHIPAIQHYLFDILGNKYKDTIAPNSVSMVLADTSKRMWLTSNKNKKNVSDSFINPKKLISRLEDINCMMSEWQQEDSHEYFMSLMSRLQEDSVPRGHKMTESIIYDIFGGLLKQEVACKSCGKVSITEQPFYDLSLHLKGRKKSSNDAGPVTSSRAASDASSSGNQISGDAQNGSPAQQSMLEDTFDNTTRYSLERAISDYFNPELIKVDKEKKGYVCENCHQTTNASKHSRIIGAPETLLVHLKKFRFNGTSSSKLKQAVSYPMVLDLTPYCDVTEHCDEILPAKYQLISIVVHEGRSLSSGHYIAHCRQPDNSWATYDDEYINKISERAVLQDPNAYYLVYTRLTPKVIKRKDDKERNAKSLTSKVTSKPTLAANSSRDSKDVISKTTRRSNKWKRNKKRKGNRH